MTAVEARDATTSMVIILALAPLLIAQKGSGTLLQIDVVMVCTVLVVSCNKKYLPVHFEFSVHDCKQGR